MGPFSSLNFLIQVFFFGLFGQNRSKVGEGIGFPLPCSPRATVTTDRARLVWRKASDVGAEARHRHGGTTRDDGACADGRSRGLVGPMRGGALRGQRASGGVTPRGFKGKRCDDAPV